MNMKTTMGLVALCLLALTAMTPSAAATYTPGTEVCVWTTGPNGCGANGNLWATVQDDTLGCITTYVWKPFEGC